MAGRTLRSLFIVAGVIALAGNEARAGFSASVDSGPEFALHSGMLAGVSASVTMGGEWDHSHRIAGRATLILIDPLAPYPRNTWGGALLVAYRYRPGWRVEPFIEVAAGVGGLDGHLTRYGAAVLPWGFMGTAAGGIRFAWNKHFALFAEAHMRAWVNEYPVALWGITGGIEF